MVGLKGGASILAARPLGSVNDPLPDRPSALRWAAGLGARLESRGG